MFFWDHLVSNVFYDPFSGLERFKTAPKRSNSSDRLIDNPHSRVSQSRTEKKETVRHDWKLDRLSAREKVCIHEPRV